MNFEKYTKKSLSAVQRAQSLSIENGNQQIYPEHLALAVLEDEALNSDLSPTLLSAYLKRRLGYDTPARALAQKDQICISFEHDIIEDGE